MSANEVSSRNTDSEERNRVIIVSPTESILTKRGNRHPVLAEKIVAAGIDVLYLSTNFYHAEKRRFSSEEMARASEDLTYSIKFFSTTSYSDNVSLRRLIGNVRSSLSMLIFMMRNCHAKDVLVVPSRPPEFVLVAHIIKKLKGLRVVVDVRDVWPDGLPMGTGARHKLFRIYCEAIYSISAECGDVYAYTAPGFLDWIINHRRGEQAYFIPIGFDEERWRSSRTLDAEDIGAFINLVYVGDLARTMNVGPLIQAVGNCKGVSLTFIGGGERLQETKSAVLNSDIGNVRFKGPIPSDEVVKELRGLHITVIPMDAKFVMPNKLFDAIGSYRPILVLGENDASRFVVENEIGWVLPFDKLAIESFLEDLDHNDVVEKSRNIEKIRSDYSKDYLYSRFVERIFAEFT